MLAEHITFQIKFKKGETLPGERSLSFPILFSWNADTVVVGTAAIFGPCGGMSPARMLKQKGGRSLVPEEPTEIILALKCLCLSFF